MLLLGTSGFLNSDFEAAVPASQKQKIFPAIKMHMASGNAAAPLNILTQTVTSK